MIEYLDLFAENNQKYNQCVKILKHLIFLYTFLATFGIQEFIFLFPNPF